MLSDIEIAQNYTMKKITEVAKTAHINEEALEPYGFYKAKVNPSQLAVPTNAKDGKLILVTAMNPTPFGEGKTTTTIGLADALNQMGENVMMALREPSLGPVFGLKGGAAGGGYAQVVPMEEINLHFTGDFHAISAANNLLCAMLDNHIHQGNALQIDPGRVVIKRVVDMNDRQLRSIVSGLGSHADGMTRQDGFEITVACEAMAILCLSSDLKDLKERLGRIIVAYTYDNKPVCAADLKAQGAMAVLLKEAIKPNLVQSLNGTPALIHGGPFANIAHGCNSLIATKLALKLADYVVTEAGFGADLGAEKFFDIKCRQGGLTPNACVLVCSIRALKHHGGAGKDTLNSENVDAVKAGLPNLMRHLDNLQQVYHVPTVVAINAFTSDSEAEIACVQQACKAHGTEAILSTCWAQGGAGAQELAQRVIELCQKENDFTCAYPLELSIQEKLEALVRKVYHGAKVSLTAQASRQLKQLEALGYGALPICMAKTQYSFSDDASLLGAPENFTLTIRQLKVSAGAGFIVALAGDIMTLPGLPKVPAAEGIDIDENGKITGLF